MAILAIAEEPGSDHPIFLILLVLQSVRFRLDQCS